MDTTINALWPWLVVAGMGALHGLNPASGWAMAAAWGLHTRHRAQAWWALLPIALGHAASVAMVAIAVVYGLSINRTSLQGVVVALLIAVVGAHLWRRKASVRHPRTGHVGLALGSFLVSGAHGAGLMLVPALVPLCLGPGSPTGAAGPFATALAAVGVHMAAMLLVTGLTASIAVAGAGFLFRRGAWNIRHHFCLVAGIHPYGEAKDQQGNAVAAIRLRCVDGCDLTAMPTQHFDGKRV